MNFKLLIRATENSVNSTMFHIHLYRIGKKIGIRKSNQFIELKQEEPFQRLGKGLG